MEGSRKHIELIAKTGAGMTGTSRYANDLYRGLQTEATEVTLTTPTLPRTVRSAVELGKRLGIDLGAFFASYPVHVDVGPNDFYFILTQTMATLLTFQKFSAPVVVTVLDIIPYLLRDDSQLNSLKHPLDRYFYFRAMRGLQAADHLVAISNYTRQTVIEHLGVAPEKVSVVYLGVDQERFRPLEVPQSFRDQYGLPEGKQYILYVGSEDPRKNLSTLIRAIAKVKTVIPDIRFLKVGKAQFEDERTRLLNIVTELELQEQVTFFDHVPDSDLPLFYNAVNLTVMPSLYEGFGYPIIESMACGTGVLAANATSLPELIEDVSRQFPATDIEACAAQIIHALNHDVRPTDHWITRASKFSLRKFITETQRVFEEMTSASATLSPSVRR